MRCLLVFFLIIHSQFLFAQSSLEGKIICIDPGHGGTGDTDPYRQGLSGEREEWINLRVGLALKGHLEAKGAEVIMTREEDETVFLSDRAEKAKGADVFLSLHHNATADTAVNFPIIYFHGSANENKASLKLGRELAKAFREKMYADTVPFSLVSDYSIFPKAGAGVLRATYGIPAVLAEASFFTNPKEEEKLRSNAYNQIEADAYVLALERFFEQEMSYISPKLEPLQLEPFEVYQEAERMKPEALLWKEDFFSGRDIIEANEDSRYEEAFQLLSRSAKTFPDSYLAGEAHRLRVELLQRMGKTKEAARESIRISAFFPKIDLNHEE